MVKTRHILFTFCALGSKVHFLLKTIFFQNSMYHKNKNRTAAIIQLLLGNSATRGYNDLFNYSDRLPRRIHY